MNNRRVLEELPRQEALRLLGSVTRGRVVFTQRALPAIPPVPHILDEGDVIIRTSLTTPIGGAAEQSEPVVAYEADDIDADTRTGWSVVVTGVARLVRDPHDRARYAALFAGADDRADCVLRIRPEIATGFRVTPYPEN
jgi:pyridoxamine 5'-phosphate oxidase-like protein